MGGFKVLLTALRNNVADGAFTKEDLARYAEAYARPGALTAMVNYYRAAVRPGTAPPVTRIDAPVLSIWGEQDPYLLRDLARPSPLLVPNARTEYIPDAGHFVQHERASRVNKILVEFLREAH
jgi:pimeloyl-ACP methyl ester carboxylesterase